MLKVVDKTATAVVQKVTGWKGEVHYQTVPKDAVLPDYSVVQPFTTLTAARTAAGWVAKERA